MHRRYWRDLVWHPPRLYIPSSRRSTSFRFRCHDPSRSCNTCFLNKMNKNDNDYTPLQRDFTLAKMDHEFLRGWAIQNWGHRISFLKHCSYDKTSYIYWMKFLTRQTEAKISGWTVPVKYFRGFWSLWISIMYYSFTYKPIIVVTMCVVPSVCKTEIINSKLLTK